MQRLEGTCEVGSSRLSSLWSWLEPRRQTLTGFTLDCNSIELGLAVSLTLIALLRKNLQWVELNFEREPDVEQLELILSDLALCWELRHLRIELWNCIPGNAVYLGKICQAPCLGGRRDS